MDFFQVVTCDKNVCGKILKALYKQENEGGRGDLQMRVLPLVSVRS